MNNISRTIAAFVLVDFIALNAWALATEGAGGLTTWLMTATNNWHYVAVADLLIALGVCVGFMWAHAHRAERGRPILELMLTALGSIGPLVYIARYGLRRDEPAR
ncbi:MAG: hypothetical protein AAGI01_13540 [Myxococcota bacterium]